MAQCVESLSDINSTIPNVESVGEQLGAKLKLDSVVAREADSTSGIVSHGRRSKIGEEKAMN